MRQSKVGVYFLNVGSLNEATRIELIGERQRRDAKAQYRKNRIPGEQARSRGADQSVNSSYCML